MTHMRDSARSYGKSDPIDALAEARAALREPDLPIARLDGTDRELLLLVDREDLMAERMRRLVPVRVHRLLRLQGLRAGFWARNRSALALILSAAVVIRKAAFQPADSRAENADAPVSSAPSSDALEADGQRRPQPTSACA